MERINNRAYNQLRPIRMTPHFISSADGSTVYIDDIHSSS